MASHEAKPEAKPLTSEDVGVVEEFETGFWGDGWDNFLFDRELTELRGYATILRKIGAGGCLTVIEELIGWLDSESEPDGSHFAVADKFPGRLEMLEERYKKASTLEDPLSIAQKLAKPSPKNRMPVTDREYYDFFGPENIAKKCQAENCQRGSVKFSAFCRTHHFENVKKKPCPWTD